MSVFWCPKCRALATTAVDKSKRAKSAGPAPQPIIIRERHCLHCGHPFETVEFQLEEGWQGSPAYQPPAIRIRPRG